MVSDAFLQLRASLDTTTSVTGGDARDGVGAVFIQKEIDRMVREVINKGVDFRPLVPRKTIRQLGYFWNLETSMGSTAKTIFYTEGDTGTPRPNEYIQLYATAKALRSDYQVTGMAQAAASSYFNALDREAKSAIQAMALTEEQAFILGNDDTAEGTGLTLNDKVGVEGAYLGLKQLLSSAVTIATGDAGGFGDSTTRYGITPDSDATAEEYAMNVRTVNTSHTTQNPLSIKNMNAAITVSNIEGGKTANRIFLCSERRLDEIGDLIQPQGRFVQGATSVELDGGLRVLSWRGIKIIGTRLMSLNGHTSSGGAIAFTETDNSMLLLDMDQINFYNIAGVDARHIPLKNSSDSGVRYDVEGGYFKTYGVFIVEKFNTHVVIWNLSVPV